MPLNPPSQTFSALALSIRPVSVTSLRRIGRHASGEPFFGRTAAARFDDAARRYGTCYCGDRLDTAIAETILRDELPEDGCFSIQQQVFDVSYLVTFEPGEGDGMLNLADLTGAHLKRLGGDNSISAEHPYNVCQQWSAAVHAHPAAVDGFVYVSRQLNDRRAMVVFDRAAPKFGRPAYTPLPRVTGLTQAKKRLGIVTIGRGVLSGR